MTKKSNATEKGGMHGKKDLESRELRDEEEKLRREASRRDEGGRASVSDEESGQRGIEREGLEASAEDDVIDRITRGSPPLSDSRSRRQ
ncbi:MAG TPA: hypothetical protein VFO83_16045 [Aggregicoccus sp.]|nr:hypothetical protein [Aggregicoccus sp.]